MAGSALAIALGVGDGDAIRMAATAPPPSVRQDILHLFVLTAFAVAQPLFDLLGRYATFFVAHGAQPRDIALFALVLCVAPAAVLALLEVAVGAGSRRAGRAVHTVLVAALVAVIVLLPLHRAIELPPLPAFAIAAATGALGAFAYARVDAVRTFVSALSPAVVVFPLLFLFHSSVTGLIRSEARGAAATVTVRNPAPVVFIVFDELSLLALMNGAREIDAARYPNFAALARTSIWYRNATSVADYTPTAVPAILTGRLPDHSRLPTASDHPHNLFTLLGGTYDLHLVEPVTDLCPRDLCPRDTPDAAATALIQPLLADAGLIFLHMLTPAALRATLPDIQRQWTFHFNAWNFGRIAHATSSDRAAGFRNFVDGIAPRDRPTLSFLHTLMPHYPYEYFASGTRYDPPPVFFGRPVIDLRAIGDDLDGVYWTADNPEGARVEQQRYLHQLAFVDRLLGELVGHLRDVGLFDDTLLVVTADHGVCFRPGQPSRYAHAGNLADVMAVPLFIKTPHQSSGVVDDRNVETIDVLPTVADLLGIELPWAVDGRSLHDPDAPQRAEKIIYTPTSRSNQLDLKRLKVPGTPPVELDGLDNQLALFGAGTPIDASAPTAPLRALLGQSVDRVPGAISAAPFSAVLDRPERFSQVQPDSGFIPAFVRGRVQASPPLPPHTPLAIAVNGVIRAVTETLSDGTATPVFGALVGESAWRAGANTVAVFAVITNGDSFALASLASPSPAAPN